jgi:DUF4097 and DUF4098 domain-containing protein YvlB
MESHMKILMVYFLTFVLICALTTDLSFSAVKSSETKTIHEKSFQILPGKKLILNTDAGDIQITPWDKSEVSIKVIGNENAADKFTYNFNSTSEEVTIEADKISGWSWLSNINLKFEIKVPNNFNIYVNTAGGDIKIGGVMGDINLKTSGGDIWGDRFEGNFVAKTSGGDINLFCSNAKIEANTSGGDIELEYIGVNKGIDLKTSGGDIKVKVPVNFDAKAELKTSGGDVECNLALNNVNKLTETKIDANINKGGKPLTAITSGGDVTVYKR